MRSHVEMRVLLLFLSKYEFYSILFSVKILDFGLFSYLINVDYPINTCLYFSMALHL